MVSTCSGKKSSGFELHVRIILIPDQGSGHEAGVEVVRHPGVAPSSRRRVLHSADLEAGRLQPGLPRPDRRRHLETRERRDCRRFETKFLGAVVELTPHY